MPFDPAALTAPFRMQPGLRRVAPGTPAVQAAPPGSPAFAAKLAALRDHAGQCLVSVEGVDARPALARLGEVAAQDAPQALAGDGSRLNAPALGLAVRLEDGALAPLAAPHAEVQALLQSLPAPWRAAALASLALLEDLALIDAQAAALPWMAVCLPSHWDPRKKVGLDFRQVHAPVADSERVQQAGPPLLRLVSGAERWERFVWTVTRHDGLDQHPARHLRRPWPDEASAAELLALATFRTERQGFLPLPGRAQALFTIEVQARPLTQALREEGLDAAVLHDALASMSDAVLAYRGLAPARDRLCAALRAWPAEGART